MINYIKNLCEKYRQKNKATLEKQEQQDLEKLFKKEEPSHLVKGIASSLQMESDKWQDITEKYIEELKKGRMTIHGDNTYTRIYENGSHDMPIAVYEYADSNIVISIWPRYDDTINIQAGQYLTNKETRDLKWLIMQNPFGRIKEYLDKQNAKLEWEKLLAVNTQKAISELQLLGHEHR